MQTAAKPNKIVWYRSPVDRATMTELNKRSDWKGLLQTLGHLGLLTTTGAAAWLAVGRLPLIVVLLLLFLHGTFWPFLLNGFHELCHKTVFKTKALNTIFLQIYSFLGWNNPVLFWASHQEHHKYTLFPPQDLEVVLPTRLTLKNFLKSAVINPWGLYYSLKGYIRLSFGKIDGQWANYLFPPTDPAYQRALFNQARFHLLGHALLVIVSLALGWWMLPILVTLAPFYGGWLIFLVNNTQHSGLVDKTNDYRLCCRTIYLNPLIQFVYWHMNYHTEHHMYAAVPCYNLSKLHKMIKADLPHCPSGLVETWGLILNIQKKQETDPAYQFHAELPTPSPL